MGIVERRQRERQERRQGILDAAERVFLEKGVAAATMDEIAQQAELSKGTLYLYFKNKDDLYLSIAVRALSELLEAYQAVCRQTQGRSGLERLDSLFDAYVGFARAHASRFRVAMSWLTSDYSVAGEGETFAEYKRLIAQVFAQGAAAIEAGKRDGSIRAELDTAVLAIELWAGALGVLMLELNAKEVGRRIPHAVDLRALVSSFKNLMMRGVRTEPAALEDAVVSERRAKEVQS